jgi:hypothetical protein
MYDFTIRRHICPPRASFRFVRFVLFRFVSFRFNSFHFVSFRFVMFTWKNMGIPQANMAMK